MAELAITPIHHLPVEVLTEIFQLHCEDYSLLITVLWNEKTEQFEHGKAATPTLDLAQTCSLWQNITISRPALWSHIQVDLNCDREPLADLVALHLSRSSPALLTLKIQAQDGQYYADSLKESGQLILTALVKEKLRWQIVEFDMTMAAFGQYHSTMIGNDCDNLQELRLPSDSDLDPGEEVNNFCGILGETPMLQTLSLHGPWAERLLFQNLLPFAQLLDIDIKGGRLDMAELQDLLDYCVDLENLYIIPGFDQLTVNTNVLPPFHLAERLSFCPNLLDLIVDIGDERESLYSGIIAAACFFDILRAPSLRSLWLEGENDDTGEQSRCFDSVKKFVEISACQLDRLELTGDLFDTDMILRLLELLPSLEELQISRGHDRLQIFDALTIPHRAAHSDTMAQTLSGRLLLPKLAILILDIVLEYEDLDKPLSLPTQVKRGDADVVEGKASENGDIGDGGVTDTSDRIYAMVSSRRNSSVVSRNLDRFILSIRRGTAPSTEAVVKWFDGFCTTTEPRLRSLARDGLKLDLDL